ncbi:hypothetical protein [Nocardioides speluncae]|uniref:hypothetical protein n=1 Tax=Nocardioides speluncae TaxID=2670337 RepID=UPI000D68729C|nr:hypothetical protein [Nocardioides speluncae]
MTPWEPSAWMREAIARRVHELDDAAAVADVVVMTLSGEDWRELAEGTPEDRTCDRCRVYVPPGRLLWLGALPMLRPGDGKRAALVFAPRSSCKAAEVLP